MQNGNFLAIEIPSQDINIGVVRVAVAAFASQLGFNLTELDDIKVAISEAVTNSIIHGYSGGPGLIRVHCDIEGQSIKISVADDGAGIEDIEWAKLATNTTSPERMGLGLSFIEEFMDSVTIESKIGSGTTITMIKRPEGPVAEMA